MNIPLVTEVLHEFRAHTFLTKNPSLSSFTSLTIDINVSEIERTMDFEPMGHNQVLVLTSTFCMRILITDDQHNLIKSL